MFAFSVLSRADVLSLLETYGVMFMDEAEARAVVESVEGCRYFGCQRVDGELGGILVDTDLILFSAEHLRKGVVLAVRFREFTDLQVRLAIAHAIRKWAPRPEMAQAAD